MVISWYGQSCFKINSGNLTLALDPFDKKIGLRQPSFAANIVCSTHRHDDHNNISAISGAPFIIEGPGEYETHGVGILGIESFHDQKEGAERGFNTIFVIEAENMKLCHMGDFGQNVLSDDQVEAIGGVDILFIPVGGKYTIDAGQAATVINQIEPKIVIPMHYKVPGLTIELDPVDKFLKEMGVSQKEAVDKFTIKKKDLPEQMQVVVMKI